MWDWASFGWGAIIGLVIFLVLGFLLYKVLGVKLLAKFMGDVIGRVRG